MNTKRATGKTPPLERLLTQLEHYTDFDLARGAFIIKRKRPRTRQEIGSELGRVQTDANGRIRRRSACFSRAHYGIHELVWLWHYGEFPTHGIDHINGDPLDNRLSNLRDVPQLLNTRNRSMDKRNKTGHACVSWNRQRNRYVVQIGGKSACNYIGRFVTLEEAVKARDDFLLANPQLGYTDRHVKDNSQTP